MCEFNFSLMKSTLTVFELQKAPNFMERVPGKFDMTDFWCIFTYGKHQNLGLESWYM